MKVIFSRLARQELEGAAAFYELAVSGLGDSFRTEVRVAAGRIAAYPTAWPVERGEIRKCLLHKFPYKLLYSVESDHVFVIAVSHQRDMDIGRNADPASIKTSGMELISHPENVCRTCANTSSPGIVCTRPLRTSSRRRCASFTQS